MIDPRLVEQFLYREARLMDAHAFDDWYALWSEDAIYWLPCNLDDYDPAKHVSLVYENHDGLKDRIDRLKSGQAWAQDPKSRLARQSPSIPPSTSPPAATGASKCSPAAVSTACARPRTGCAFRSRK